MDRFVVRRVTALDEAEKIFILRRAALGWKPGALDHVGSFAVDSEGLFAGELNGKVIGCICALKYCEEYAFISHWIIDKEYRGMGYGSAIWRFAMANNIPDGCNCALHADEESTNIYCQYGFKNAWHIQQVSIKVTKVNLKLTDCVDVSVKPTNLVSFEELEKYDTSVHLYARQKFLKFWIFAPNCYSFAAIKSDGHVVGYGVVRSAYIEEDGWIIGPLFADDSSIARALYLELISKVAQRNINATITVVVPYGESCNSETLTIVNELSGDFGTKFFRMYKNGDPFHSSLHKIFGVTPHVG